MYKLVVKIHLIFERSIYNQLLHSVIGIPELIVLYFILLSYITVPTIKKKKHWKHLKIYLVYLIVFYRNKFDIQS